MELLEVRPTSGGQFKSRAIQIATGLAHLNDFMKVGGADTHQLHTIRINGFDKKIFVATGGLVPLVVLPHLSGGSNGLNSNAAIEQAAQVIRGSFQF